MTGQADTRRNAGSGNEDGRSGAFELFILGELTDGVYHGYLLRDILARMLGPYRQISWAAIYPLIHRLERQRFITREDETQSAPRVEDAQPAARQRHAYAITESGRERFHALLAQPGRRNAGYRELFAIKLLYLNYLTPEQRRALFAECRDYLTRQRDHLRHVFTAQSTTSVLPDIQREQIFRMMRFRLAGVEAEIRWLEEEMVQLKQDPT
ncbi:MAG TPA: PadR family transcriptional regulator [Ktedonobacterales bacterium]